MRHATEYTWQWWGWRLFYLFPFRVLLLHFSLPHICSSASLQRQQRGEGHIYCKKRYISLYIIVNILNIVRKHIAFVLIVLNRLTLWHRQCISWRWPKESLPQRPLSVSERSGEHSSHDEPASNKWNKSIQNHARMLISRVYCRELGVLAMSLCWSCWSLMMKIMSKRDKMVGMKSMLSSPFVSSQRPNTELAAARTEQREFRVVVMPAWGKSRY